MLKTKHDVIYQLGIGVANTNGDITPFIGAGMYWKIQFNKK